MRRPDSTTTSGANAWRPNALTNGANRHSKTRPVRETGPPALSDCLQSLWSHAVEVIFPCAFPAEEGVKPPSEQRLFGPHMGFKCLADSQVTADDLPIRGEPSNCPAMRPPARLGR